MEHIRIGIIGGAGYTAGELLRLLINHPAAEIAWIHSSSNAGKPISDVHEGLLGETDLVFSDSYSLDDIDLLFLCSAHGQSTVFWSENKRPAHLKVIDLAQDYRDESEGYVYGLPELQTDAIAGAASVANPGCFATAIQLALLPLAKAGLMPANLAAVNITGITGSTGAGVKPGATTHFSWRTDNLSVYKPFSHQHLAEIVRSLGKLQPGVEGKPVFIPVRGNFARGIFVTATIPVATSQENAEALYSDFYAGAPFTVFSRKAVDMKQVINTNKAAVSVTYSENGVLLVTVAIDNLLKGASGQAVQNMNLMFGLDPRTGLRLKPSAF